MRKKDIFKYEHGSMNTTNMRWRFKKGVPIKS